MEVDVIDRLKGLKEEELLNELEFEALALILEDKTTQNQFKLFDDNKILAKQLKLILKNKDKATEPKKVRYSGQEYWAMNRDYFYQLISFSSNKRKIH